MVKIKKYSSHLALTEGVTLVTVTPAGPDYYLNHSCDYDCGDEYLQAGQLFESFEDCREDCLRVITAQLYKHTLKCKQLREQQHKLQNQNES